MARNGSEKVKELDDVLKKKEIDIKRKGDALFSASTEMARFRENGEDIRRQMLTTENELKQKDAQN